MLRAQEFTGLHTGTAIASAFDNMFTQWKIPKENIHVVIRDNAQNIEDCGIKSLGCTAHALQLAACERVLSQLSISDCVCNGRKKVGHFRYSQPANSRLREL